MVRSLIASLVLLDVTLATFAFFLPELWFQLVHGAPYVDPEGFLRRTGANWLAFAIFQAAAVVRLPKEKGWLLIVAGMRLGDMLTDWTYIAFATHLTPLGWVLLGAASPGNAVLGWYLIRVHKRL